MEIQEQRLSFTVQNKNSNLSSMMSRSKSGDKLQANHGSESLRSTFKNNGITVWNLTSEIIKNCKSIGAVKEHIKNFVKTLPF